MSLVRNIQLPVLILLLLLLFAESIESQIQVESSNATFASTCFTTVSQRCVLVNHHKLMHEKRLSSGFWWVNSLVALQHVQDKSHEYDISAKVQHLTLFWVYIGMNGGAPFQSMCMYSRKTTLVSTWGFNLVDEQITAGLQRRFLVSILQQNIAYFDAVGTGQLTSTLDGSPCDTSAKIENITMHVLE